MGSCEEACGGDDAHAEAIRAWREPKAESAITAARAKFGRAKKYDDAFEEFEQEFGRPGNGEGEGWAPSYEIVQE